MSLRIKSPLAKKARRGFRGYPVATIAYYGQDAEKATKVSLGFTSHRGEETRILQRWFSSDVDARIDLKINGEILELIQRHGVKSVGLSPGIIGCPHEEGKDYPDGETCPQCPYWKNRDRWTGEVIH